MYVSGLPYVEGYMPVGVKTLPTGVPHCVLVAMHAWSVHARCVYVGGLSYVEGYMPAGVKTLPAGMPLWEVQASQKEKVPE